MNQEEKSKLTECVAELSYVAGYLSAIDMDVYKNIEKSISKMLTVINDDME